MIQRLRGKKISIIVSKESDDDEAFVRLLAKQHAVKIHVKNFETEKYSRENKISIA